MKQISLFLTFVVLLTLSACAGRINVEEAAKAGAKQLSADNLDTLVSGNSLHMVAWDNSIEADVDFAENGKLNAVNSVGDKTFGRWHTDNERHMLCMQFKFWGAGDTNCYKVFQDKDRYLLFNNDGTLAQTFVPEKEVNYTLADINAGALAQPPPGSRASSPAQPAQKKRRRPEPTPSPEENSSLLSTLTLGLLGNGGNSAEPPAESGPAPEVISQPLPPEELRSKEHQQLLDSGRCPGCALAGLDFTGVKLKGADLQGADLSGANLQETNLIGANLKGANLSNARLTDAILIKADLEGANLADANLHWADLSRANLKNANLERAYLVKALFYKADLTDADMTGVQSQRTIFEKAIGVPAHLLSDSGEE
ncbi:MAG: hypothetical protein C0613_13690 [Desulfobulbaceae bacterium]|nr:MAG: hypothetical protein C0613_13690 [Desulfobulbaceae bacterium]